MHRLLEHVTGMSWQIGGVLVAGTCHYQYVLVAWWCTSCWNMSLVCFGSLVVYLLLEHVIVISWQVGGVLVAGQYHISFWHKTVIVTHAQ